jgi:AraC family transcriptional regulator
VDAADKEQRIMRSNQRELYAERIERVLHHIEDRISRDEVPDLAELAGVAAMSAYHFHRVFRLLTGETVGEAIRRIRLACTLPELASGSTVTQAAGASGYATPQGFARALKAQAGISATEARSSATVLDTLVGLLRTPSRDPGGQAPAISIEVVSIEPLRLLAARNVGDYAELNHGFERVFNLVLTQVAPDALLGIYGVPHDDPRFTKAEECSFDCALAVGAEAKPQGGLVELIVGGGPCVRLRHLGDYDRLHDTIDLAYAAAISMFEREVRNAPLFIHYLDDPEEVAEDDLRSDIFLPVV